MSPRFQVTDNSYLCVSAQFLIVSDSLWLHGHEPTSLLCPWDFLGKNIGLHCHFLLQRIFLTQGSNLLLHISCIAGEFFTTEPPGKPRRYVWEIEHTEGHE